MTTPISPLWLNQGFPVAADDIEAVFVARMGWAGVANYDPAQIDDMDYSWTKLERIQADEEYDYGLLNAAAQIEEGLSHHSKLRLVQEGSDALEYSSVSAEGIVVLDGKINQYAVDNSPPRLWEGLGRENTGPAYFKALVQGTMFMAYCEADTLPAFTDIGHEFREILSSVIDSTDYFSARVGPSPIHPDLCVIVVGDDAFDQMEEHVWTCQDDVCIFARAGDDVEDILQECFRTLGLLLFEFATGSLRRRALLHLGEEIQAVIEDCTADVLKAQRAAWWQVWERGSNLAEARQLLTIAHQRLIEHSRLMRPGWDQKSELKRFSDRSPVSRALLPYMYESSSCKDAMLPESIGPALDFLGTEIRGLTQISTAAMAASVSAVVAIVIGLLR